jgi:hypothetical protein
MEKDTTFMIVYRRRWLIKTPGERPIRSPIMRQEEDTEKVLEEIGCKDRNCFLGCDAVQFGGLKMVEDVTPKHW